MNEAIPTVEQVFQQFKDAFVAIARASIDENAFLSHFQSVQNQEWTTKADAIETLPVGKDKMLVRVAYTHSINRQGGAESQRLANELKNLADRVRSIVSEGASLDFHFSSRPESDGPYGPRVTCMARGILRQPS
jgi:hypothetical protein